MGFSIGEAATRSGCTPPTIRYYESIGLIGAPLRSAAGRRSYGAEEVARLVFIRRAREFGMGIPEVRALLTASLAPASAGAETCPLVEAKILTLRAKRAELEALDATLSAILAACDEGCRPGEDAACAIYDGFRVPGAAR